MSTASVAIDSAAPQAFAVEWQQWHAEHERVRADAHGFLAVTGITWLTATPQPIDGIPGLWSTDADGPVVELRDGEHLEFDGDVVAAGRLSLGRIAERDGVILRAGEIEIEVARRGGHDIVRPRDPAFPLRLAYRGTESYAPRAEWVIQGRYTAFPEPRDVTVGAAVEGLQHVYAAPGQVEFSVDGTPQRLTVFNGHTPGTLLALFVDATSGVTTYSANRALAIGAPAEDGAVVLDFNRATNLPCAYTEFATCPLPPIENRLAVAIEAGEKKP